MKKINLYSVILSVFLLVSIVSQAKKVDVSKAETVAQTVVEESIQDELQLRSKTNNLSLVDVVSPEFSFRSTSANAVYYYVFNVGNDGGFVIVAGDDVCVPVIGYSTTGSYDKNNLPPNFSEWMLGVCDNIDYALENDLEPSEDTRLKWQAYLSGDASILKTTNAVGPLVQTKWNQGAPYNNLCPKHNGVSTLTGCGATAMAQVMKRYNHPLKGNGSSSYKYEIEGTEYTVPAVTYNINYDWNNMTNGYNSSSTQTQKDAVALLMYHCGTASESQFGTSDEDGTGSTILSIAESFLNHFRFDKSLRYWSHSYYTSSERITLLKQEIDAARPVYYSGTSSNGGGHAFICDGYDNENKFHFNWGWGGTGDGFFDLNSHTYKSNNDLLTSLKPDAGGSPYADLKLYEGQDKEENPVYFQSSQSEVIRGQYFKISVCFINLNLYDIEIEPVGFALVDANDKIIQIFENSFASGSLSPFYYSVYTPETLCKVSDTVAPGDYFIRCIYKKKGDQNYSIVNGMTSRINKLPLKVSSGSGIVITEEDAITPINIYPNPVKENLNIKVDDNIIIKTVKLKDLNGRTVKQLSGFGNDITMPVSELPKGIYLLVVEGDAGSWTEKVVKE